jgi:histidinol-phosphate aminotransferase
MNVTEPLNSIKPRVRVANMPEYHPPLGNRNRLRLDFNENTLACSPKVKAALEGITAADLTRYPEREPVEVLVAQHFGLNPEEVMLTNGVDEAIHVLCQAFLDVDDELLLPVPTYTMYEIYASATDARLVKVQAAEDFSFPFEGMLKAITPRTKLIAIANPNSPTGSVATREQILQIAEAAPGALILVDEAYFHFYGETVMDLIGTVPNLIVARTFSKAYGLASLRVGLLAGTVKNLRWVRRVLSPYSVNTVALTCLAAAIEDQEYLQWYVGEVKQARAEFLTMLASIGIRYWPTQANFVLVNVGVNHKQLVAELCQEGILVRDRSADPGCDGYVRITIGTRDQMQRAIPVLKRQFQKLASTGVSQ